MKRINLKYLHIKIPHERFAKINQIDLITLIISFDYFVRKGDLILLHLKDTPIQKNLRMLG